MADPAPVTSATMGGATPAAAQIAYAERGTFRGLFQAYTNNADLVAAVASREMVLPAGRTIAGGSLSLNPTTAVMNVSPQTVVITGTNFTPQSVAVVDGVEMPTVYTSATSLSVSVPRPAAAVKTVGVKTNGVVHPTQNFTITSS